MTTLPQSRRPDGSLRPAVRVKAGYVPPEEQQTYDRWKTEPQGGPPGADPGAAATKAPQSKTAAKNAKRAAKKKAEQQEGGQGNAGPKPEGAVPTSGAADVNAAAVRAAASTFPRVPARAICPPPRQNS